MSMILYVDDLRTPEDDNIVIARSVNEAIRIIQNAIDENEDIEYLDLDHDMGDYANDGGDCICLLDWLVEHRLFIPIQIHTMNPVGRANMERIIRRYW